MALAATITAGAWWLMCGAPGVRVEAASTAAHSSSARHAGSVALVRLAGGQRTAGTLTHELAHALAGVTAGHDECFRAAHIDVVAFLAGAGAADDLARAYAAAGLTIDDRRWPSPVRGVGDGFVDHPVIAGVPGDHRPGPRR